MIANLIRILLILFAFLFDSCVKEKKFRVTSVDSIYYFNSKIYITVTDKEGIRKNADYSHNSEGFYTLIKYYLLEFKLNQTGTFVLHKNKLLNFEKNLKGVDNFNTSSDLLMSKEIPGLPKVKVVKMIQDLSEQEKNRVPDIGLFKKFQYESQFVYYFETPEQFIVIDNEEKKYNREITKGEKFPNWVLWTPNKSIVHLLSNSPNQYSMPTHVVIWNYIIGETVKYNIDLKSTIKAISNLKDRTQ